MGDFFGDIDPMDFAIMGGMAEEIAEEEAERWRLIKEHSKDRDLLDEPEFPWDEEI